MFVVTELLELTVFMNKTYVLAFSQIGWIAHENRRAYLFPKRICFSLRFKTSVKSLVLAFVSGNDEMRKYSTTDR